ncbi:hypothetical protein HDE_11078 [Halotydeus destructor]|nr:hypothetical protein HDE_11078 [Halotydeus destructor]
MQFSCVVALILLIVTVIKCDQDGHKSRGKDHKEKEWRQNKDGRHHQGKEEPFAGNAFHGDRKLSPELEVPAGLDPKMYNTMVKMTSKVLKNVEENPMVLLEAVKMWKEMTGEDGRGETSGLSNWSDMFTTLTNLGIDISQLMELLDVNQVQNIFKLFDKTN